MKASWIRWAILALVYVAFLSWYGGSGDPLSRDEIEEYKALLDHNRKIVRDHEEMVGSPMSAAIVSGSTPYRTRNPSPTSRASNVRPLSLWRIRSASKFWLRMTSG